jgi:hypothetical protein
MTLAGPSLLVTWQSDAYDAADTGRAIYLLRSANGGQNWSDLVNLGWSYHCSAPGAFPTLAGANDGSAVLVFRAEKSSLVSECSRNGGITWSDPSPVSADVIAPESPFLAFKNAKAGAALAYVSGTDFGTSRVMFDTLAFMTGAWGNPRVVSGTVTSQYAGFRNPNLVPPVADSSGALNITWDAFDAFAGSVPVILSRRIDGAHNGSSYSVMKGRSQNEFSSGQTTLPFQASRGVAYSRILSIMDSANGASVSIEIGAMRRISKGGDVDTVRFAAAPPDSLILDVPSLMQAGSSLLVDLPSGDDTLELQAAIYGHGAGKLFAGGKVGFEIVRQSGDSARVQFGMQSAASVSSDARNLILYSVPIAGLSRPGGVVALSLRPVISGLQQNSRLTTSLAHVYSTVSESPVSRIVSGVGGDIVNRDAPSTFALEQNYPNPFNPSTTIRYSVPVRTHVSLSVYNTLGQQIALLVDEIQDAGNHEVRFVAWSIASGAYFYRIMAGTYSQVRKLMVIK